VTEGGDLFLVNTRVDEPRSAHPSIILNWASEMAK
jgi:hypothetical protein